MIKLACISIGYPNFRYDIAQEYLDNILKYLKSNDNIELYCEEKILIDKKDIENAFERISYNKPDVFLLLLGTYSYGDAILMYLQKFKKTDLIMWSFREPIIENYDTLPLNSLCALNMYTSFLKRMNFNKFLYIYGSITENDSFIKLEKILKACEIKKELQNAKFCVVGGRVDGFYLSNIDELKLKKSIGCSIENYSIAKLIHDAQNIDYTEVEKEMRFFKNMVNQCNTSNQVLERSARIYIALKDYAQKNNISGYAIKCWSDFQEIYNIAVCGIIARLNQESLLCSCEGDIASLITMFIQNKISQIPVFLTDLVNINENGIVKLWHCGCASPALSEENSEFTNHPTMKSIEGLTTKLTLKYGSVTICKFSEENGYKMLALQGECIKPDRNLSGNQGDIKFNFNAEQLLQIIISEGLEHHYSVAYDCDIEIIKILCKLTNIRFLSI